MKLSYSKLSTYQLCPRKFQYSYIEDLEKVKLDDRDIDKEFGSAFHEAMFTLWSKKSVDEALQTFTKSYPIIDGEEDKNKNLESGLFLVKRYHEAYKDQINSCEVLEQEVLQEFDVNGITWRVKLDLVFRDADGVHFRDFKTKNYLPRYNYYTYNTQMDSYFTYCNAKYGECLGGIIDNCVIRGTGRATYLHPDDPDQLNYSECELADKFEYRENENGERKRFKVQKAKCSGYYAQFSSDQIIIPIDALEDFRGEVKHWHERILSDKNFLKNKCSCFAFNRKCDFMELCESFNDECVKDAIYQPKNKDYEDN